MHTKWSVKMIVVLILCYGIVKIIAAVCVYIGTLRHAPSCLSRSKLHSFIQLSDDEYPSVEEFVRKCKVFSCLFVVKTGLKLLNVGVTHNNTSDCGANVVSG